MFPSYNILIYFVKKKNASVPILWVQGGQKNWQMFTEDKDLPKKFAVGFRRNESIIPSFDKRIVRAFLLDRGGGGRAVIMPGVNHRFIR